MPYSVGVREIFNPPLLTRRRPRSISSAPAWMTGKGTASISDRRRRARMRARISPVEKGLVR
ncbi:MAG TPA: hypothetical protein DD435_08250 [Cyanobacteria bacterium UBA8530]|nr:hypothetical protein [Cyanobacteria bacterium UBA8530]